MNYSDDSKIILDSFPLFLCKNWSKKRLKEFSIPKEQFSHEYEKFINVILSKAEIKRVTVVQGRG
jgi:hypothetical protein